VAATLNGQTALVQGLSALEGPVDATVRREYLRTAACLFAGGTFVAALALAAAPAHVAGLAGLPAGMEPLTPWLAAGLILSSAFVFLNALLHALRAIGKLACLQVAAPLAMAVAAWPAAANLRDGHPRALAGLLSFSGAVSVVAALAMLAGYRHTVAAWFRGPGRAWSASAARHFFSVSGAMLASGLISSGALLIVRARIVNSGGLAEAGQFDAAWNISMNHVTLVLGSLQAYCFPVFSSEQSGEDRSAHLRAALAVAALASSAIIVALASLKPLVLAALYSGAFHSAAMYLRWTLLGDYLKVTSWILSLTMIARAEMIAFLLTEVTVYGVFVAGSWILARWFPAAESASIAFVLMYAAHLAICYAYLRRRHSIAPGWRTGAIWLSGLAAVVGASAAAWTV
jgi:hypothetical protein